MSQASGAVTRKMKEESLHQYPKHMFRMKSGEVETKLFEGGPMPEGWYEDKFKAGYKKPKLM